MSLINNLQLQEIDDSNDDISSGFTPDGDDINLGEQIDEDNLEQYWNKVVQDIHDDPTWFNFDNK